MSSCHVVMKLVVMFVMTMTSLKVFKKIVQRQIFNCKKIVDGKMFNCKMTEESTMATGWVAKQCHRLGITMEHHNLAIKWQVSAVQIKIMVIFWFLNLF